MSLFFTITLSDNLLCIKFCLQIFKVLLQLSIATPLICLISDARAIDMHPCLLLNPKKLVFSYFQKVNVMSTSTSVSGLGIKVCLFIYMFLLQILLFSYIGYRFKVGSSIYRAHKFKIWSSVRVYFQY